MFRTIKLNKHAISEILLALDRVHAARQALDDSMSLSGTPSDLKAGLGEAECALQGVLQRHGLALLDRMILIAGDGERDAVRVHHGALMVEQLSSSSIWGWDGLRRVELARTELAKAIGEAATTEGPTFDLQQGWGFRLGAFVAIPEPKCYELLTAIWQAQQAGEPKTRKMLADELWPKSFMPITCFDVHLKKCRQYLAPIGTIPKLKKGAPVLILKKRQ